MEQRSKRKCAASEPNYYANVDNDDSDTGDVSLMKAPKVKRSRKSATNVDGSKAHRVIFRELEPIDILNLSRTSKSLRNILMSRSSIGVWKSALSRFRGLPECPEDMSEPAYANLLFCWEDDIAYLDSAQGQYYSQAHLRDHKLVKQSKPLTERIWNNIKDPLTQMMQQVKKYRLEQEFKPVVRKRGVVLSNVLHRYAALQPLHSGFPPLADVAILPAFRTVIEDTFLDEEVTAIHFQEAMRMARFQRQDIDSID
ncbi:hypothetical protein H0H92_011887 [Tricholoma furcatifolium]|nr:hypothetical protein H0H92_011887 [Tricholoma furcatifolium]